MLLLREITTLEYMEMLFKNSPRRMMTLPSSVHLVKRMMGMAFLDTPAVAKYMAAEVMVWK